ncbi:hypothetical protein DICSQDRAFT_31510, partial [Dichomitus squalens LYAD-421 SS1]
VQSDLERAIALLHDCGFVFGDLHAANVIVVIPPPGLQEEVRGCLINFYWAGADGVARFPTWLDPAIEWPARDLRYGLLKKQHD